MTKSFEEFADNCGLVLPITDDHLSENNKEKTLMHLELMRFEMAKLKKTFLDSLDTEKAEIGKSVSSLWQVLIEKVSSLFGLICFLQTKLQMFKMHHCVKYSLRENFRPIRGLLEDSRNKIEQLNYAKAQTILSEYNSKFIKGRRQCGCGVKEDFLALAPLKGPTTVLLLVNSDCTVWAFEYTLDSQKRILDQKLVCRENSDWGTAQRTGGLPLQPIAITDEVIFQNCPRWSRLFWCPSLW